jgi:alkanesulfonate monooxygenase SsuD/methylene tetrahydromethanopterin reductase-like flavin-dependent oxidoreductase (luciferase family)
MMDEGLEALRLLFTAENATFEGKHYTFKNVELFPKSRLQRFPLYVGGHNLEMVKRAAKYGEGWLPGWRPLKELEERTRMLKELAAGLGRDPAKIEVAPQFSATVDKTLEAAEKRYMESGLVAHRKSLAYTGRDLSQQVVANLVGSPDVILEKIEKLRSIGVDHATALMFPAGSVAEFEDQVEWFAKEVLAKVPR